jgi:glycosyltransferase involved in cell wall biosynthesis
LEPDESAQPVEANTSRSRMSADISIIIPSKNRLWALPKAVDSCRSATLRIQIMVVDDGSTDGTADWLKGQPDVTIVHSEGWGKPWAVNKAGSLATGKYLRYLDSDDWLKEGANEVQFDLGEREQADLVVAGMEIYRDEKLAETEPWLPTDDFIAQQLGETAGSHYSAFLFRREFMNDIPHRTLFPASDFASRDDRCVMLEVALKHPKLAVYPLPTLCHRHHSKGRLQFQGKLRGTGTNIQHLYIYRQILGLLEQRGELTERRKAAAIKVLWPLAHWIACTHPNEACEVANWIFELDPNFQIPNHGILGVLFRWIGFRWTERLLSLRRALLKPLSASF